MSDRDGEAVLAVVDEGPGVDPDRLENIFDRYYSDRPASNCEDTQADDAHFGVGLWIVRQNAAVLGGHVSGANRPEGGFMVTVTLPLARSGRAALPDPDHGHDRRAAE